MSRPAYSAQDQTAKERICYSFWQILSDPKKKLSVIEICRLADVNKNTFYYHFETFDALAEHIIGSSVDQELAAAMLSAALTEGVVQTNRPVSFYADGFQKLCLLASSDQPVLINILRKTLRDVWCSVMKIHYSSLSDEKKDVMDFMLGGILSVLGQSTKRKTASFEAVTAISSRPFFKKTIANLYDELKN